jgi:peptidoglycan/LPS O-acetylase OafA/YrhL
MPNRKPTAQPRAPKPAAPPAKPAAPAPKAPAPKAPAPQASSAAAPQVQQPPAGVRLTAVVLLLEAVGMLVATGYSADGTISGKSYQTGSGVALTLIAFGAAAALAALSVPLYRLRPWSRTPALLAQVCGIVAAIYLFDGDRPDWGVPILVLALAASAGLLAPESFKALNR